MILMYKIEDGTPKSVSIWERNTETGSERCIYEEENSQGYKETYGKWFKPSDVGEDTLPVLSKNDINNVSRISRDDAILEMI